MQLNLNYNRDDGVVLSLQQCGEVSQRDDVDVREGSLSENVIMMVVGDDIPGSSSNGTVHKLVVIGIGFDHLEMVIGGDEFHERAVDNGFHDKFRRLIVRQPLEYFDILFQNFVRDTKRILALDQRLPHQVVAALARDALYKTVCIEDNLHRCLFELVKIHLVDFVESLLVEFPRFPQRIKTLLHPCRIVSIKHILQFVKSTLTLVERKHLKQMYLQGVKYSCVHNPNKLIVSGGKGTNNNCKCKDKPQIFSKTIVNAKIMFTNLLNLLNPLIGRLRTSFSFYD